MKTVLIRHAESGYNVHETTHLNSKLTPLGVEQATKVSEFVANNLDLEGFRGFVSPFFRCLETASFIRAALKNNINFTIEPRIGEHTLLFPQLGFHVMNLRKTFKHFTWNSTEDFHFIKENCQETIDRFQGFVDQVKDNSIIVSHGTPVLMMAKMLMGETLTDIPDWEHQIPNASLTIIEDGEAIYLGEVIG